MSQRKKFKSLSLILAVMFCLGNSKCTNLPLAIDPSISATMGNDKTMVFQGMGRTASGYLFAQKADGTLPSDALTIIVPKLTCKRESCADIVCFRKDGSQGFHQGIKADQDRLNLKLSDIIGKETAVGIVDEGEYSCIADIYYVGSDDLEHSFFMNGFIRLNILSSDYEKLGCSSPAKAWAVNLGKNCSAEFSTAGRSVVCGEGCKP